MGNLRGSSPEGKSKMEKSSDPGRRGRIDDGPWAILHRTRSGVRMYIARGFSSPQIAQRELNDLLKGYPKDDPWRTELYVGLRPGAETEASSEEER